MYISIRSGAKRRIDYNKEDADKSMDANNGKRQDIGDNSTDQLPIR